MSPYHIHTYTLAGREDDNIPSIQAVAAPRPIHTHTQPQQIYNYHRSILSPAPLALLLFLLLLDAVVDSPVVVAAVVVVDDVGVGVSPGWRGLAAAVLAAAARCRRRLATATVLAAAAGYRRVGEHGHLTLRCPVGQEGERRLFRNVNIVEPQPRGGGAGNVVSAAVAVVGDPVAPVGRATQVTAQRDELSEPRNAS